ncbi:uncharacterized protein SCHCODRAFT_02534195 [Schizophyllum commune H4-8]|nr:uncharacterized protein SCHCODRAFT_02534195 [Schizophyllum commune H4-8]KAI5897185.1 hypothetical protein SCHCODRAFT_02534195 [Schizophyllum commune H4-8]
MILMPSFFPLTLIFTGHLKNLLRGAASIVLPMQDERLRDIPTQLPGSMGSENCHDISAWSSDAASDDCLLLGTAAIEKEEAPQDASTQFHPKDSLHRAPASSIGRLPLELLSEIFLYSAARHRRMHQGRVILRRLLTQICRSWRFAALGTVWLWNDIVVNTGDNDSAYNLLRLQLERSKQCPLDVLLYHDEDEDLQLDSRNTTRSWELVLQHSHKWRNLRIENIDGKDFETMTRRPVHLPLLKTLVVASDLFYPSPILFDTLADAPRLFIVSLTIADLRGPLRFPPGWRLRSLTLDLDRVLNYAHCMPMLRGTEHTLEHLKIEIAFCMDTQDLSAEGTICMPKLKRLRYTSYGRFLTKRIEVPGLASLKIKDSYGDLPCMTPVGGGAHTGLSLRRLTKLVLEDARWDTTPFLDALRHAPNVRYLEIKETRWWRSESCVTVRLLEALTRGGADVGGANSTCPLPALDEMRVSLRLTTCTSSLIRALARMALSRRTVDDASDLKPLRAFMAERLTVRKAFGRTVLHTKTLMAWGTGGPEVTCDELVVGGVSCAGQSLESQRRGRERTKIRSKAYVPMSSSRGYESA